MIERKKKQSMREAAGKIVKHNLKKDGWHVLRDKINQPGPADLHALRGSKLFLIHINTSIFPESPIKMNRTEKGMIHYLADKMQAFPYSVDVIFNSDMTVKDLSYRYISKV